MGFRFEFDAVNHILLCRFDGRLTDEVLAEGYEAIRRYATETDAGAGIFDFSAVTEFPVSSELVRLLARQAPAIPEADKRLRVAVVPQVHAYGLVRMFQIMSEETRPLFRVVKTMDEALALLGVRSSHFDPMD